MNVKFDDELTLIESARRYDEKALVEIYDRYSPYVFRYAVRLLGDHMLAEDCLADTFLRLLKSFRQGQGPKNYLQAYLFKIAHNWITDYYRKKPTENMTTLENIRDKDIGIDEHVSVLLETENLQRVIQLLPLVQQQVIILKYLEGMDNMAIGQVVGKRIGAVKALVHRAITNLQKMLIQKELP